MITAFQANAFQNNAFQIAGAPPIIVVTDTHDGWRDDRWEKKTDRERRKREDVLAAYEYLVEGKSPAVEEITAPFTFEVERKGQMSTKTVNFDKMLTNLSTVERLWSAYLDMDDEEALRLLL